MIDLDFFDNPDISEVHSDIDFSQGDDLDFPELDNSFLADNIIVPTHIESFVNTDDFHPLQSTVSVEDYINTNPISDITDVSLGNLHNSELTIDNNDIDLHNRGIDNDMDIADNTPLNIDETDLHNYNETHNIIHSDHSQVSFGNAKYTDAEISKLKDDVSKTEYEVSCRRNDVSNWESKVSLNDTKEHHSNGDYDNAIHRLNEAKQRYNDAASRLNSAKVKLNNAT